MPHRNAAAPSLTHYVAPATQNGASGHGLAVAPAVFGALSLLIAAAGGALLFLNHERPASQPWDQAEAAQSALPALRGSAEDITDRRGPALHAVASRMSELRARQDQLTIRQDRLAALLKAAEARKIVVKPETLQTGRPDQPLVLARLAALPAAGPRPIPDNDGALAVHAPDLPPALRRAEELDLALRGLEWTQDAVLDALEEATEDRIETLASVPGELGLAAPTHGIGGPFVELRGVEAPLEPSDRFEIFQTAFRQVDELERIVNALPIRSPLDSELLVSSVYGRRQDPFLGRPAMHTGIDLAAERGSKVHATGSGTVRFAGWNGGYGRMVEIDHGNGHRTRYGHLSKITVEKGEQVSAGQAIGAVGSSGRSTGPHLHYELVRDGRRRDPASYLDKAGLLGDAI